MTYNACKQAWLTVGRAVAGLSPVLLLLLPPPAERTCIYCALPAQPGIRLHACLYSINISKRSYKAAASVEEPWGCNSPWIAAASCHDPMLPKTPLTTHRVRHRIAAKAYLQEVRGDDADEEASGSGDEGGAHDALSEKLRLDAMEVGGSSLQPF